MAETELNALNLLTTRNPTHSKKSNNKFKKPVFHGIITYKDIVVFCLFIS